MTAPFILCALVTAISAIISLGFSIAAALGATDTARTMALYACARSMALMIVSAVPFLSGSIEWIAIEAGCAGPALHAKLLGGGRRPYCPLSGLATLTATATLTAGRSYGPAGSRSLADTSRMNTMGSPHYCISDASGCP